MACFCPFLHYIAHSSTRGFWTLTRAHGLMKSQEWLKLMEIVNNVKRNPNHVKILNFDFSARLQRADTYGRKILKCSKWPGSYSKLFISDFEHVKILTCASWRARGHGLSMCWPMTWSLCVLNLGNLWWMVMKIFMITWKHKMAPSWRHGRVIT